MSNNNSHHDEDYERRVARPLDGFSKDRMFSAIDEFMTISGLPPSERYDIERGAFIAKSPDQYRLEPPPTHDAMAEASTQSFDEQIHIPRGIAEDCWVHVNDHELDILVREGEELTVRTLYKNPFRYLQNLALYPWTMYGVIAICSIGAMVQGFDETAVNGAQTFYTQAFGINQKGDEAKRGLVNAAPYLVSAITCWLNSPLNVWLGGRRKVILLTCFISFVSCLGQGLVESWQQLLVTRLLLGLGIGPKSATIPIYASECAPTKLRGGLVMMWQMWTAFGIMCGYISGVIFRGYTDGTNCDNNKLVYACSKNWRFMLASPMIFPLVPMLYFPVMPESPRFLLQEAKRAANNEDDRKRREYITKAYKSLQRLNPTKLQAARELFSIYHSLEQEPVIPLLAAANFTDPWKYGRTRRALVASIVTMFFQQFCGVNVLAYYSTPILKDSGAFKSDTDDSDAFKYSLEFGIINFVVALFAFPLMDTLGRRSLLLLTFPFMTIFQAVTAYGVARKSVAAMRAGMYCFCFFYSLGEGPVPFVYASESLPLRHRDSGMGFATSVNWLFNFLLALIWPVISSADSLNYQGAFAFYAVCCYIGWTFVFIFVRETRNMKLEEMGVIFEHRTGLYLKYVFRDLAILLNQIGNPRRSIPRPTFLQWLERDDRDIPI